MMYPIQRIPSVMVCSASLQKRFKFPCFASLPLRLYLSCMNKIFSLFVLIGLHLTVFSPVNAQTGYAIPFENFELPNGLRVVLHRDTTLPVVSVNIAYRAGSINDPAGKSGLANITGILLMQGSKNIPPKKLVKVLDECGASFGMQMDVDRLNIWSIFPSHLLETALWIESDRMGYAAPTFTQARLDSAKMYVEQDRKRKEKNPFLMAPDLVYAKLNSRENPYSHVTAGKASDVAKLKLADIKAFAEKYIAPNNASITIAGDFDPKRAKELVTKYFQEFTRAPDVQPFPSSIFTTNTLPDFIVSDHKVDVARLYLVFPTVGSGKTEEAALHFTARLLAGDRFARLNQSLMLNNKLAIDVQAYQSSQQYAGTFWIQVTCRPEIDLGEVYKVVMNELEEPTRLPITDEEIAAMKNKMRVGVYNSLEKMGGFGGRADALNLANLVAGDPSKALDILRGYEQINLAAIKSAMNYLTASHCLAVSIVPKGRTNQGATGK